MFSQLKTILTPRLTDDNGFTILITRQGVSNNQSQSQQSFSETSGYLCLPKQDKSQRRYYKKKAHRAQFSLATHKFPREKRQWQPFCFIQRKKKFDYSIVEKCEGEVQSLTRGNYCKNTAGSGKNKDGCCFGVFLCGF